MVLQELIDKRAGLVEEARTVWTDIEARAKKEDRDPTDGDREKFDKIITEGNILKDRITTLESDESRSKLLAQTELELNESKGRKTEPGRPGDPDKAALDPPEKRFIEVSAGYTGRKHRVPIEGKTTAEEYRTQFAKALVEPGEFRALQADSDTGGGYLAPQQWQAELIQDLDNLLFMRQICNVLPPLMTGSSLGKPSLDNDPADPTWTAEIATGSEDSTMDFGKRELTPHPLAQRIKVSKQLLRQAAMSVDSIVRERLSYKTATVHENAFMNGIGASQPLGIFTASDNGITTSQDVSTGNTATAMTFDGLRNVKYNMPAQWRRRSSWIFHRDGILQLVKIKDGDGRPMWQPSIQVGEPDRLFGDPVFESEYAPNTFTASLYVGIFGDFSFYQIIDSLTMSIQVALELYAETNQNGYFARSQTDGMPVLAAAFRRVKLAAS